MGETVDNYINHLINSSAWQESGTQASFLATVRHKYKVVLQLPVLVSLKDKAKHKAKEN